jgi:hypothetical protein
MEIKVETYCVDILDDQTIYIKTGLSVYKIREFSTYIIEKPFYIFFSIHSSYLKQSVV